jgi:hypothetical protein
VAVGAGVLVKAITVAVAVPCTVEVIFTTGIEVGAGEAQAENNMLMKNNIETSKCLAFIFFLQFCSLAAARNTRKQG